MIIWGGYRLMPLSTILQLYLGVQVLLVVETGVSSENHRPVASHGQTLSHNVVSSTPLPWFELTTLEGTDCTCSCNPTTIRLQRPLQ